MWFYDLSSQQWHRSPGPIGAPAMCGKRWGHAAVGFEKTAPFHGDVCVECRAKTPKEGA